MPDAKRETPMVDILLFTKDDEWSHHAGELASLRLGSRLAVFRGSVGDPFPEVPFGDLVWTVSFLSPWIIPPALLNRSRGKINFHPGSADYPGIGCYNFALYENAKMFGPVCHVMDERVDRGPILQERLFPIAPNETVYSLKLRTMTVMLAMFHDALEWITSETQPAPQDRQWQRRPFTRAELNELRRVDAGMNRQEIERRIRATTFPGYPGAFLDLHGHRFAFSDGQAGIS